MNPKIKQFFNATDPSYTLFTRPEDVEKDKKYYIDFASVRGGEVIEELKDNITVWYPDTPTCQLFTGHIGSGKSTELLKLKLELEQENYHVVYFESSADLEMGDVDVGDILLCIAQRVSESLETLKALKIPEPRGFKQLLQGAAQLLQTEIEVSGTIEALGGKISASSEGKVEAEYGLPGIAQLKVGIGAITDKTKASPESRSKLRGYLEPRTNRLLEVINQELFEPAQVQLKALGKAGLVVIVDNLDRVTNANKDWEIQQQEYLFVDRGEQLRTLNCHVVYTMPLALRFSNQYSTLTQRFVSEVQVLPMIPIKHRDGSRCEEGMSLLKKLILARIFPDLLEGERGLKVTEVFDRLETCDRLCEISGGHVRNFLRLFHDTLKRTKQLPLQEEHFEETLSKYRHQRVLAIDDQEWELLHQVAVTKRVAGNEEYQKLIRSQFVYEYRDAEGYWFDVNPIIAQW
ncbi:ATP-binding protein [Roseofilum sp. BLCC_M154]|uniref:ATP-binding protein n=1 Tax=Roseofilum acuticapitatum BLCC-M154 TaxID=3022444 RepID=A0ABT7ALR7_9CYAN|nr:hypothetical protein [Roseofilum acuticapitatum]MDJ1167844.1 ATP-binding protein [Roseofilum acuticapitatum BLCC-M154]